MHSDPDTYRAESLESWREVAPGWEARREWLMDITAPVIDWIVERLDPEPGHTVLDIAAGTGISVSASRTASARKGRCCAPTSRRRCWT